MIEMDEHKIVDIQNGIGLALNLPVESLPSWRKPKRLNSGYPRSLLNGLFIESVDINARSSLFSGFSENKVKLFAKVFVAFVRG